MALKRFYMRNIYGKDIDNEIWDNLCNKKFVKHFSPPEPQKHFLQLSHFRKQGYDEESAMKGLEVKDIAQWEDSHYKAGYNSEKSVAEDLHKSYSANHWKVIRELFQILGFTGIDDKRIFSSNIISETFTQSCERFIKVLDQSLLLFGFKSCAKVTSDLNSAIRAINAIAGNWCGYTVKINRKKIGPKEKQVWERSYQINRQPYDGLGFGDKGHIVLGWALKCLEHPNSLIHPFPQIEPSLLIYWQIKRPIREIALRHKINRLDAGKNYALGDPKSKKEPKSEPETGDGPNPQTQASSPASQSRNNDPKKSQTMDMDSMLAEIAMLAEIRK
ncbi:hypothetical protein GLOIN_2v1790944 [Rhizophagus irregularis DAOM 181602=DAOM 197198]|nr:hypothetical protein GLOIN_2v1790944 [Rhizophagus irregularis DAOM 181602=DAOM 197198]